MPEATSLNNCGNCKTDPNCDCMCHKVPVYASNLHVYHRPAQMVDQEPTFKMQQINHLRQRFTGTWACPIHVKTGYDAFCPQCQLENEKGIKQMYEKNLYT